MLLRLHSGGGGFEFERASITNQKHIFYPTQGDSPST